MRHRRTAAIADAHDDVDVSDVEPDTGGAKEEEEEEEVEEVEIFDGPPMRLRRVSGANGASHGVLLSAAGDDQTVIRVTAASFPADKAVLIDLFFFRAGRRGGGVTSTTSFVIDHRFVITSKTNKECLGIVKSFYVGFYGETVPQNGGPLDPRVLAPTIVFDGSLMMSAFLCIFFVVFADGTGSAEAEAGHQPAVKCFPPEQMACADGLRCIPTHWRCNGLPDCADASDEPADCRECLLVLFPFLLAFLRPRYPTARRPRLVGRGFLMAEHHKKGLHWKLVPFWGGFGGLWIVGDVSRL